MKNFLILILILNTFISISQKDRLSFNMDISFGIVNYTYDDITNSEGGGSSNIQWFDTVHSLNYSHSKSTYRGLNTMIHVGIHIPIIKSETFSLGLRPKVGFGRLGQIAHNPEVWDKDIDPKRLKSGSLDAQILAYVRYNSYSRMRNSSHLTLLGGYRFINSFDNYSTPLLSLEFGQEHWSFGFYAHLYKMNYYRTFSNGDRELAKSMYEFGLHVNFFLHKNKSTEK